MSSPQAEFCLFFPPPQQAGRVLLDQKQATGEPFLSQAAARTLSQQPGGAIAPKIKRTTPHLHVALPSERG